MPIIADPLSKMAATGTEDGGAQSATAKDAGGNGGTQKGSKTDEKFEKVTDKQQPPALSSSIDAMAPITTATTKPNVHCLVSLYFKEFPSSF
jgi:hypothetical protein